jgi:gamma-glutamylcyclotransferase (GGCT)/AIG2-like uncharacterized protein YtfP
MSTAPPLFVYGSLIVTDVLEAVLGRVPAHRPAHVAGWRRAALRERPFPGLVPGAGSVDGIVLTDLTARERDLLDAFEGPMYERRDIALTDGTTALAYVCVDELLVLGDDWDVERFRRDDLPAFLEMCAAWSAGGPGP